MRNDRARLFWLCVVAAFALRLLHLWLIRDNPLFDRPIMDAAYHDQWARGILAGTWPGPEPFFRAPLYMYLLAGLYAVFGGAFFPVLAVQALISALGAGLAALTADRLWGRRAGWLAGLLYAGLWTSIYYAAELLLETLSVTLNLLLLWLLLDRAAGRPGWRRLGLAGLALGLSAIARPNILIVVPAVVWYLLRGGFPRPTARGWAAAAVGLLLPILPVTLSNAVRGHDLVAIATQGGVNFYIGNNPASDGRTAIVPGTRPTWQGGYDDAIAMAEKDAGRDLKPSEVDRWFLGRGLAFWAGEPLAALELYATKLRLLLGEGERSNDKYIYAWRDWSPLLRLPIWPGWTVVLVLGALGWCRRDGVPGTRRLTLGVTALYAVSILLFFVNARFRLPVAALLTIPAGAGADALWTAVRGRRWVHGLIGPAVAALLAVAALSDLVTFREHRTEANPFHHFTLGNAWLDKGRLEDAGREYAEAIAIQRRTPQPHFDLISDNLFESFIGLRQREGRNDEALRLAREWVDLAPEAQSGRLWLGELLLAAGRLDEAAAHYEIALRSHPDDPRAQLGEAWVLLQRGDAGGALRRFQLIARRDGDIQALFGSGLALVQLGRDREAEPVFRDVLVREPGYWQAWGNLGEIRDRAGRIEEAREAYQRLLQAQPADARARAWLAAHPR
ncbi:MAG: tetratricopeptide repeat protein [Candidatus Latescibacteria bacterium]|nr:tetratricopeptide repeat protein [Candidatus Latescibacterota bacterium]